MHPQKFGCTPKNEDKRVHVPPDEKTCGGMGYQINQNIILTGDLNSDLFTSHNYKLIDTINLFNLTNVIEKPARVTEHSCALLDPIIISDSIHYSFSNVLKMIMMHQ